MQPWSQPLLWAKAIVSAITNACTWNASDKSAQITLSNGNLTATDTSTGDSGVRIATSHNSGKYYIEWTSGSTFTGANTNVGICTAAAPLAGVGNTTNSAFLLQQGGSGAVWFNGSQTGLPQIGQFFTNRVAGMAIDFVNARGWFRVDGASGLNYWNGNASYDPATNTGGVDISALFPTNAAYPVFTSNGNGSICSLNSTFAYAPPSGFSAWCPAVACDPYFGNVVLLMGYEGANGSTGAPGWTDQSPSAHGTANTSTNTFIDTSQFKFGTSSGHWNIALTPKGSAYFGASNDWEFGSGRFTVETWIRFNSTSAIMMILGTVQPGDIGWYWHMDAANNLVWTVTTDGSTQLNDITYAWSPSLATWYFITVDYDGTKYRMYVNGVMVGSSTTARNIWNSGEALGIGTNSIATGLYLDGWLDETRVTKGVARYASDAGFVVPTAAFPRVQCVTGNWNSLDKTTSITLSNNNLTATSTAGSAWVRSVTGRSSGKYYYEGTLNNTWNGNSGIGLTTSTSTPTSGAISTPFTGASGFGGCYVNGVSSGNLGSLVSGNIVGIAADLTASLIWLRVSPSGNWNGSGTANPATGTGGISFSALTGVLFPVFAAYASPDAVTANFGASAFSGTIPSGFTAWG